MALNNTAKAAKEILFFNRVPKVGSQSTMELLKSLAINNDFHFHKDRVRKMEIIKLMPQEEVGRVPLCLHTYLSNTSFPLKRLRYKHRRAKSPQKVQCC